MPRTVNRFVVLVTVISAVVLATVTAAVLLVPALAVGTPGGPQLPDLDQETPGQLTVLASGNGKHRRWLLGFSSAVSNVGAGPLTISGHRPDESTPTMTADQIISGPTPQVAPGVGKLRYVRSATHEHWHLIGFERYELRRAGSTRPVVRDRKSGFCLGDRYPVQGRLLAGAPPQPVIIGRCGLRQPGLLNISEGISVGYGDIYAAYVEFQDLPLDGLRDGHYVLVHRVDPEGRLHELSKANNSASVLLDVRWQRGTPDVTLLRDCPDTDRCDVPLTPPAAAAAAASKPHVRILAKGLEIPWDIAFLPGGGALVTERPGRVRLIGRDGRLRKRPVARIPVSAVGEGGLLGLVLDPGFTSNRLVYLYYTSATGMKLERWRWTAKWLVRQATLINSIRAGSIHDSGRIGFGPDGRLYVATGDSGMRQLAQDPTSLNGKFLALTPKQYRGSQLVSPEIVAMGLRNPQGFDWQPGTRALVANDHGPTGFDGPEGYDEVNLISAGGNYGWPNVIGNDTGGGLYLPPIRLYVAPIAPSGATFLHHPGTAWTGQYVLAALRGTELRRLQIRGGRVVSEVEMLRNRYGRLRTVREAPNGDLCVLTSNRDGRGIPQRGDDKILCVTPPRP
jgi:glucose/arabinose dehydrogenase